MAKIATSRKKTSNENNNASFVDEDIQQIEKLAYQFFAERGFLHGFDKEDWAKAEAIVRRRRA